MKNIKLRLVTIYNSKGQYTLELLTNNFDWTAEDISELYIRRWKVETFFSDIKRMHFPHFERQNEKRIFVEKGIQNYGREKNLSNIR